MGLFLTAAGEHNHTDELGYEYAMVYRLFEEDDADGFARVVLTQLPGSRPIAEAHEVLRHIIVQQMEEPSHLLLYFEHIPPEHPGERHHYFLVEAGIRKEISEIDLAVYLIPHPVPKSCSLREE